MADHHFVPRVYLRNFCEGDDGFLFGAKFNDSREQWNIREYHVNKVCYEEDFYTLDESLVKSNGVPEDIIETTAFGYEPKFVAEITERLKARTVTSDDLYKLGHFYLNIKHRNPKFRSGFTIDKYLENFDVSADETRMKYKELGFPPEVIESAIAKTKYYIENNPEISKRSHNNVLLLNINEPTEAVLNAFNKLALYDILIYEIESPDDFFMIADNPGYSIDITGKVHNVKFKDDKCHLIPITSKIALIFYKPENDEHKNVKWVKVSKKNLDTINYNSFLFRNDFVFCENRTYLQKFIEKIRIK